MHLSSEEDAMNASIPNPFIAKVHEIATVIDYQEGAIVSRELIRKEAGTITLFAFDEGQGLSEHTAPFDAFVQVLEGKVEIAIGGAPQKLTGGQFIIMPAGIPHALKALARFKMMLVMIRS
jgi:quercetin dioxygenase-like cupin family protein